MKQKLTLLWAILFFMTVFISCEKDEEDNGTSPELPPQESLIIDLDQFTIDSKSHNKVNQKLDMEALAASSNYEFAAGNIGFWNVLLTVTLVVPVAAFQTAFTQTPEFIGESTWQWSYDVNGFASTHTARLTGQIRSDDVKWEMYVQKSGVNGYPEFKWFEGTSALDGNSGTWTLYHSYEFQDELLEIDWSKSGNEIGQVTYSFVRETNNDGEPEPFNGSYLTYGLQSGYFDAFYDIYFYDVWSNQFVNVDIEWSTTEYYGRVKAEHHFDDTNWHCWDNTGEDITCE